MLWERILSPQVKQRRKGLVNRTHWESQALKDPCHSEKQRHRKCCDLTVKRPPWLLSLNTWCPAGGAILGDDDVFDGWGLERGDMGQIKIRIT